MIFFSQQKEDEILYHKYLNYRNGIFIELGAMDGITYSNTLFFEKELGWNGVLIEPTNQFNQLKNNRPNCININCAISEIDGEVEFIGNLALGGITNTMHENHRIGWKLDEQGNTYMVKSIPISEAISHLNLRKIDLFSIDVEGGELEVLKTFNWGIPVYIILIEMSHDEQRNELCREMMRNNQLEFDMVIGVNEVWINKNFRKND